MRFKLLVAVCVFSISGLGLAQGEQDCLQRSVPVSVLENDGKLMSGLAATNFRGEVNHEILAIEAGPAEQTPGRLVIVLDASGSMGPEQHEAPKFRLAVAVSADAIVNLPAATQLGMVIIGGGDKRGGGLRALGFETGRKALLEELQRLSRPRTRPRGMTPLFDGISRAVSLISTPGPQDAVYVITDAGENISHTRASELQRLLQKSGVRCFAFVMTPNRHVWFHSSVEDEGGTISALASRSGGFMVEFEASRISLWDTRDIFDFSGARLHEVANDLGFLYQQMTAPMWLKVRLSKPVVGPQTWKLAVVDKQGRARRDLRVIYPHELAGCDNRK